MCGGGSGKLVGASWTQCSIVLSAACLGRVLSPQWEVWWAVDGSMDSIMALTGLFVAS